MAKLTELPITADGDYDFSTSCKIGTLFLKGGFGGGTVTFSQSFDGVNYLPVPLGVFTSDTFTNFISAAPFGRLTLAGSTAPNLIAQVVGVVSSGI